MEQTSQTSLKPHEHPEECTTHGLDEKDRLKRMKMSSGFTQQLPVAQYKHVILRMIRQHIFTIIVGETGSGKSTQIPQYIVDDPELRHMLLSNQNTEAQCETKDKTQPLFRLCITQPRRMAVVAMARRVASERGCPVGHEVGYTIRFNDCSDPEKTVIRYMTDGVALREILSKGGFAGYQVFIVDEAHERSLNTDVLFSLIKKALSYHSTRKEPPLIRFVITSATLDTDKFSAFFNGAPVLRIPGRTYPVEIIYTPFQNPTNPSVSSKLMIPSTTMIVNAAVNVALRLHMMPLNAGGGTGHILVFLTGKAECDAACEATLQGLKDLLKKSDTEETPEVGDAIVIPLYGTLSSEEQALVFEPTLPGCRKIIFSTNVAETSVTVEDVEFVVDLGLVKQKSCNNKTGAAMLSVVWIAQSQAEQRAGRAGRSCPGKCFRVYSKEQYNEFRPTPLLEIHRSNLSSVVLQLKALGLDDILNIDFIDPPSKEALLMSLKQLFYLGAFSIDGELTSLGEHMVSLPLDPIYARCLVGSITYDVPLQVIAIVSMLSVDNVWMHPSFFTKKKRDSSHPTSHTSKEDHIARRIKKFFHPQGDHLTLLNIFNAFNQVEKSQRHQWCVDHGLMFRTLQQVLDVYQQLQRLIFTKSYYRTVKQLTKQSLEHHTTDRILLSLCQGFFINLARITADRTLPQDYSTLSYSGEDRPRYTEKLWVTLRDGQLVRYEPMTHYGSRHLQDSRFDLVIFTDILGPNRVRNGSTSAPSFSIGAIRVISAVQHEWVKPLLKRFTQLDVRRLALRFKSAASCTLSSEPSVLTPFKAQVTAEPLVVATQQHLDDKKEKVESARQKYLARRSQKALPEV